MMREFWSASDKEKVRQMFLGGKTDLEIAKALGRTIAGISHVRTDLRLKRVMGAKAKEMPGDFASIGHEDTKFLSKRYGVDRRVIHRWRREAGIVKEHPKAKKAIPEDFVELFNSLSVHELRQRWNVSSDTIRIWSHELGLNRKPRSIGRQIPEDFVPLVRDMDVATICEAFGIGIKLAYKWLRQTGAEYRSNASRAAPMPDDFPTRAKVTSSTDLEKEYGVSSNVVARWRRECGIPSPKLFQPGNQPRVGQNMISRMGTPSRPVFSGAPIDGSLAAQAAQYLRANWGGRLPMVAKVEYTDLRRDYPKGMYAVARRDKVRSLEVMTAEAMIELAESKGFNSYRFNHAA